MPACQVSATLPVLPALLLACLLAGAWPSKADAEIRRCVRADGSAVYTDRRCDDVGAIARVAAPHGRVAAPSSGCARNLQDLLFRVSSAIDARDANRLAGTYHWAGMSAGPSRGVMDRLATVAHRPLIAIVPVMAAVPMYRDDDNRPGGNRPEGTRSRGMADPAPVALRIEQTLDNGITPSSTTFGLRRYFGCLWIQD